MTTPDKAMEKNVHMAITSQASWFLNSYHILENHEKEQLAIRIKRAQDHNVKHPDKHAEEIGYRDDPQTGLVSLVCLAFAVELYLKAVFEALGAKQKGHHIRKLFDRLPIDVQNELFNIQMKSVYGATLDDYKKWINIISNGFEEFRYSYEYKELEYHRGFALGMIATMEQLISDLRGKKA